MACGDGRSTCEVAQDRLAACDRELERAGTKPDYFRLPLSSVGSCSEPVNACVAACIVDTSCGAINYIRLGKKSDPNSPIVPGSWEFEDCIGKCANP